MKLKLPGLFLLATALSVMWTIGASAQNVSPGAERELQRWMARDPRLQADPGLMNNPTYLRNHPNFALWLQQHPGAHRQIDAMGAYDNDHHWHDRGWWGANHPDWAASHHPEWAEHHEAVAEHHDNELEHRDQHLEKRDTVIQHREQNVENRDAAVQRREARDTGHPLREEHLEKRDTAIQHHEQRLENRDTVVKGRQQRLDNRDAQHH